MDLHCATAINLTDGFNGGPCPGDQLYLGCHYGIYLFFELPSSAFFGHIKEATLILFKIPGHLAHCHFIPQNSIYSIYPLLDFYNVYNRWYAPPRIDAALSVDYDDQACMSYSEIDITMIVQSWMKAAPENKGLLLTGAPNGPFLVYASDRHECVGMRPTLRLKYEEFPLPLSTASCVVRIL
ncbi:MAG: hypothetical protein LBS36_00335 [Oscillospiraceae bacterium]|nr:hypothetical protein [Oscillospiraceae bacterium]